MVDIRAQVGPYIEKLKQAYEQQAWDDLLEHSESLKAEIASLMQAQLSDNEKASLAALLQSLIRIYSILINGADKHKQAIGAELRKLNQDHKAVHKYMDSSKL